ncbi:MAG: glycerol-3-phosphate acyltransferase [Bacteroidota bacterium]|nr:glycerol-3-phosphate acyltransferase [Bacteroidota bacterium]
MDIFPLAATLLFSFLLGSIPTAYLAVKRSMGEDLRLLGTGNIGAMNAYEVSRSKTLGFEVLTVDIFKGACAVIAVALVFGNVFTLGAVSVLSVVLGHNFSPWIGFKGGRGLAPAAGAIAVFAPVLLVAWCSLWIPARLLMKNIHAANVCASIVTPCIAFFFPRLSMAGSRFSDPTTTGVSWVTAVLCLVIITRHIEPLRAWVASKVHAS